MDIGGGALWAKNAIMKFQLNVIQKHDRWQMMENRWKMNYDQWQMTDNRWQMKYHRWQMMDNRWQMKYDRWQMTNAIWRRETVRTKDGQNVKNKNTYDATAAMTLLHIVIQPPDSFISKPSIDTLSSFTSTRGSSCLSEKERQLVGPQSRLAGPEVAGRLK